MRELGFRDLGGLVFDQHRFNRPNEELVRGKLAALEAVDGELRALEAVLDDPRPITELREPGIAACVRCGALHGTDARFCPSLRRRAVARRRKDGAGDGDAPPRLVARRPPRRPGDAGRPTEAARPGR